MTNSESHEQTLNQPEKCFLVFLGWVGSAVVAKGYYDIIGGGPVFHSYLHSYLHEDNHLIAVFLFEFPAVLLSTGYCLIRLVRHLRNSFQFSLGDLFAVSTAICLAVAVAVDQYRIAQKYRDITDEWARLGYGAIDFMYPPLVTSCWPSKILYLLGLTCLSYVLVRSLVWTFRKCVCLLKSGTAT